MQRHLLITAQLILKNGLNHILSIECIMMMKHRESRGALHQGHAANPESHTAQKTYLIYCAAGPRCSF